MCRKCHIITDRGKQLSDILRLIREKSAISLLQPAPCTDCRSIRRRAIFQMPAPLSDLCIRMDTRCFRRRYVSGDVQDRCGDRSQGDRMSCAIGRGAMSVHISSIRPLPDRQAGITISVTMKIGSDSGLFLSNGKHTSRKRKKLPEGSFSQISDCRKSYASLDVSADAAAASFSALAAARAAAATSRASSLRRRERTDVFSAIRADLPRRSRR